MQALAFLLLIYWIDSYLACTQSESFSIPTTIDLSPLTINLIHLPNKLINILLPIPQIAPLHKMLKLPSPKPTIRIAQLERPQKVTRLLEVRPHSIYLMDQILHTHNAILPQILLDDLVIRERDALLIDFPISAFVDQGADGFEVRVAVGDEGFDDLEHFGRGFCEADEGAVVDLEEAEELEDLARFGGDFVDTGKG